MIKCNDKEKKNNTSVQTPREIAIYMKINPKLLLSISKGECKLPNNLYVNGYVIFTLISDLKKKNKTSNGFHFFVY